MEDTTYKLREIKYHRLVHQIKKDIAYFVCRFNDETIVEFMTRKYPGVKVVDMGYTKDNVWDIEISIPKPVQTITINFTISPRKVYYE